MKPQQSLSEAKRASGNEAAQQQQTAELLDALGKAEATGEKTAEEQRSLLPLFGTYLVLTGTVIGLGVFAFYSGHKRSTEILFWISVALTALIPVILLIYAGIALHKQWPVFMLETRLGRFLLRHHRAFTYASIFISFFGIAESISMVGRFPRLAAIASCDERHLCRYQLRVHRRGQLSAAYQTCDRRNP
jgi:hypothetical protein